MKEIGNVIGSGLRIREGGAVKAQVGMESPVKAVMYIAIEVRTGTEGS